MRKLTTQGTVSIGVLGLLALWGSSAVAETALLSIQVPHLKNQYVYRFDVQTWGANVLAVCHIPPGRTITAGHGEDPEGAISGETKEGESTQDFDKLFLVDIEQYQPNPIGDPKGVYHPATFAGSAIIWSGVGKEFRVSLKAANFLRIRAARCP